MDEQEEDVIDYEHFNYDLIQTKLSGVNAEPDLWLRVTYGVEHVPWKMLKGAIASVVDSEVELTGQ